MFREMVRKKQLISEEECIELLKKEPRGVLSVLGDDDYPYGMPLNHYYCEEDGKISIKKHNKASFCVYDQGFRNDGEWALNIRSVIVFGKIEIIDDMEKILNISRLLSYKFTKNEKYIEHEIVNAGPRTFMFALVPEYMTGKKVKEA